MGLILGWPHANFLYTAVASVSHTIYGFPWSCSCAYILPWYLWSCTYLTISYIYAHMWVRLHGSADCPACNVQQATAAAATGSGSLASWRLTPHYPSLSVSICPTLFLPPSPLLTPLSVIPTFFTTPLHTRGERDLIHWGRAPTILSATFFSTKKQVFLVDKQQASWSLFQDGTFALSKWSIQGQCRVKFIAKITCAR